MKRRRKKEHHEEEMGEAWLLPYSDLMTLLLAVFIVLFAVSKMDSAKAEEMARSFRGTMMSGGDGIMEEDGDMIVPLIPNGDNNLIDTNTSRGTLSEQQLEEAFDTEQLANLQETQQELENFLQGEGIDSAVDTYIDERGLVITLNNAILFDSGSANLKAENEAMLLEIAGMLISLDNYIRIEGHTDNRPISTDRYPSNWELSCDRAAGVVRLFSDNTEIDPMRLVSVGYGEYKPVADNETPEGRALNRRIDIIVLNMKYNSLEEQLSDLPVVAQETQGAE